MTERLQKLFLFSIPLFIVHGLEEIFSGFYIIDSHVNFMFGYLVTLPNIQALFLLFQIMLGLMLIISYLLLLGTRWQLRLMCILGIVFVYEFHHLYKAVDVGGYYPGLITAIPLYIVGFLFWKELFKNIKTYHGN
mgnify:CR=1 FL=1